MKTEVEVLTNTKVNLRTLNVGDWFYSDSFGNRILMIKGDDTVYDGTKTICMKVQNGILARVNSDANVIPIYKVKIQIDLR